MRDINDIIQQNNDTLGPVIQNLTRQGRYVVAQFEGLHLVSIESFTTLRDAQEAAEKVSAQVGSSSTLHFPLPLASRAADRLARGTLQGDPDSFAYRQATRREEQRRMHRATEATPQLPAGFVDLTLEAENTAFERIVAELAHKVPADRAFERIVDGRALDRAADGLAREAREVREERDRVAEGGLVSQEV